MTNLDEIAHNTGRIALALEALAFVATGETVSFDPEPPLPPESASPSRAASSDASEPGTITQPTPPSLPSGQGALGGVVISSECAPEFHETVKKELAERAQTWTAKFCPVCGASLAGLSTPAPDAGQGT